MIGDKAQAPSLAPRGFFQRLADRVGGEGGWGSRRFRQYATLVGGNGLCSVAGIVALLLAARHLQAREYGQLIAILTYPLVFDHLFNFQTWAGVVKHGAEARAQGQPDRLPVILRTCLFLDTASCLAAYLLGVALAPFFCDLLRLDPEALPLIQLACLGNLINQTGTAIGVLRLEERYGAYVMAKSAHHLTNLLGTLLSLWFGWGSFGLVAAKVASFAVQTAFFLGFAVRAMVQRGTSLRQLVRGQGSDGPLVKFLVYNNLTSTADMPIIYFDTYFITYFISLEMAAVYNIFKPILQLFSYITEPIGQLAYYHFTQSIAAGRTRAAVRGNMRFMFGMLLLFIPLGVAICLTAPYWIGVLFKDLHVDSLAFVYYFVLLKVIAYSACTLHSLTIALGLVRQDLFIILVANVVFVTLCLFIRGRLGISGIVLAIAVQNGLVCVAKMAIVIQAAHSQLHKDQHGHEKQSGAILL